MFLFALIAPAFASRTHVDASLGYAAINPFLVASRTIVTTPAVSSLYASLDVTFVTGWGEHRSRNGCVFTEGGPFLGFGYDSYHTLSLRGGYAIAVSRDPRTTETALKIFAEGFLSEPHLMGTGNGAMAGFAFDTNVNGLLRIQDSDFTIATEIGASVGIEDEPTAVDNSFWLTSRVTLALNVRL